MDWFLGSSRPAGKADLSTPTLTVDTGEASSRLGDGGPSSPKDHPPAMAQAGPQVAERRTFPETPRLRGELGCHYGWKTSIVFWNGPFSWDIC